MTNSTEEPLARYTIKASVFTDLFTISKYLLQMYQVLHPEDTTATEDDASMLSLHEYMTNSVHCMAEQKKLFLRQFVSARNRIF